MMMAPRLFNGMLFIFLVSGLLSKYHYKPKKYILFAQGVARQPRHHLVQRRLSMYCFDCGRGERAVSWVPKTRAVA